MDSMWEARPLGRRRLLRGLAASVVSLAGCEVRGLRDSVRQAWGVLIDLSGTAAADRDYYTREVEDVLRELARSKPSMVVHVVGFSSFARPLAGGQAQLLGERVADVVQAVRQWPLDGRTDIAAAFAVAHDLLRKSEVERRALWILSDGIQDPENRWRTRPAHAVPLPRKIPLTEMVEQQYSVHWDALDEHQLGGWQRAFEEVRLPAVFHLRGYVEGARARLRRPGGTAG